MSDGDHDFGPRGSSGLHATTEILRRPPMRLRHLPLSCRQRVDGRCRGTYGAPAPKFHDFGGTHSSEQHPHRSNRSPMNSLVFTPAHAAASANSRAWPFEEARRLIKRLERLPGGADKTVIFETGYGPSGLPHIGTFGEVARTTMVRHAFELLTEGKRKTRLICFSDDMDGLRKVPTNVPNQAMLHQHLDQAADPRARSVRQVRELRAPQQRDAARLPRPLRLRLRILCRRPSATRPACFDETLLQDARGLRQGHGHHPADARARTAGDLLAVPPASRRAHGPRAAGADDRARRQGGHHHLRSIPRRARRSRRPSPAAASSASGRPTGRCAGRRSASITRWPART